MIGSRLAERRKPAAGSPAVTTVKTITGTTVYSNLEATHQQIRVQEAAGPLGEMATVVHDLFFYERLASTDALPVIVEKYIVEWVAVDYDVISAQQLDELAERLRVETKRSR
jgi:hypothetical protein